MLLAPTAEHQSCETPPQVPPGDSLHSLAPVMAGKDCGRDAAPLGSGAPRAGLAGGGQRAGNRSRGEQAVWPRC